MKGDIHSFTMRYISMIYYKRLQRYGGCKLLYLIGLVGSYVLHVMQTNIVTLNIPNMNDGKNERYCALAPWFITLSKRGRFIRTDLDGRMQNAPVATHSSAGTELINCTVVDSYYVSCIVRSDRGSFTITISPHPQFITSPVASYL